MSERRTATIRASTRPRVNGYSEILDRAEKGDKTVLPSVRKMLDEFPDLVSEVGDLGRVAKGGMIDMLSGDNLMVREAQERHLEAMIKQIEGPRPTAVERLLAEQIAICWLHVRHIEIKYAHLKSYSLAEGDFHQRCLDRAQKRYLRSIKALSQVRRLLMPAIQFNLASEGGKQVNIASRDVDRR